jgi:hypothetical protein
VNRVWTYLAYYCFSLLLCSIVCLISVFYKNRCISVGKPERKRLAGRPRRRWEDNNKMDLREIGWGLRTGYISLRIGTSFGLLWTRWWTSRFHKMLGNYLVAERLVASQEGLSSMELVS